MKTYLKRIVTVVITLAMVLTSVTLPGVSQSAKAAGTAIDESDYKSAALTVSNPKTNTSYTGDSKIIFEDKSPTGDYYKLVYTISDTSTLVDGESALFTFKPYTSAYAEFNDNPLYYNSADYDEESGKYTSYISINDIKASMGEAKVSSTKGINMEVTFAEEPTVTLESLTKLTKKTEQDAAVLASPEMIEYITLRDLGLSFSKYGTSAVQAYVKVTQCDKYSQLKVSHGASTNLTGNLDMVTRYCTLGKKGNSGIRIHYGYRTSGGYGSGMGVKESGIYKLGTKKTLGASKNVSVDEDTSGICLRALTKNTNAYICGLVFADGKSFSLTDPAAGAVQITEGFTEPANLEKSVVVAGDYTEGIPAELDESDLDDTEYRDQIVIPDLQKDIDAAKTIKVSDCPDQATYDAIQTKIAAAEAAVKNEELNSTEVLATQKDLNDALEDLQALIQAKKDFAQAKEDLKTAIDTAKAVKDSDTVSSEQFAKLQTEIASAETVYNATYDSNDATTISGYATTLNTAKDALNTLRGIVSNKLLVGLRTSIEYCKGLEEADYQSGFDALAPAITSAESVLAAGIKGSKTDAQIKTARDALEAVRVALVKKMSTKESAPKSFRILEKNQVIAEMGAGINLGNTFDGGMINAKETSWQAYKTTKAYIKALHDAGYNTVRIPVTWNGYIKDDYSIDEEWIGRVQEVVDYCIDQDMYAIINIHHDGAANHDDRGNNPECWLNTYEQNIEKVYQTYEGVWNTIAERFKNYDEHLIFESMNEVTDAHGTATNEDTAVLNALNQLFVNTVRATGSNNTKRWLGITGRFATFSTGTTKPADTLADMGEFGTTRLMFAVHIYKGSNSVQWYAKDTSSGPQAFQNSVSSTVKNVENLDKNMPIYIGEYGVRTKAQDGSATGYNNAERAALYETCNAICMGYGVAPVVWDQGSGSYGGVKTETGIFTDWDRPNLAPVYDDVVWGTIRGTFNTLGSSVAKTGWTAIFPAYGRSGSAAKAADDKTIAVDPASVPFTKITTSETKVTLDEDTWKTITAETEGEGTNDVVLWTTENDAVATVYNGKIHGKSAGITTIHAKSMLGEEEATINVVVKSTAAVDETDEVVVPKGLYVVEEGEFAELGATLKSSGTKAGLIYTSSNEEIVTVSSTGKITAVSQGTAYVIITSKTGASRIVKVKVPENDLHTHINVALNVFKDGVGYPGSQTVKIDGDGQYTVTWDLSKDKPKDGFTLDDLVAVYIYDTNATAQIAEQAQIRYDKVTVNDQELTLKDNKSWKVGGFKSAIKANGVFDTNDPINGWDGCVVEEVTTDSKTHTVSFSTIENPTKFSVTFTIKDIKFREITTLKKNEATEMTSLCDEKLRINEIGDSVDLSAQLTEKDTDSYVTFYSTNPSVINVSNTAQKVDADGKVKISATAINEGTATVCGITENGLVVLYSIGVGEDVEIPDAVDPTPDDLDGGCEVKGHSLSFVAKVEPQINVSGREAYYHCDACGKNFKDEACAEEVTDLASLNIKPLEAETTEPTPGPTNKPGTEPGVTPTDKPGTEPTVKPTEQPGTEPTAGPSVDPTVKPSPSVSPAPAVNACKKIKAAKKKLTIKKKKSKTLTFKLTNANANQMTTDTIKVTSSKKKIVKVTKINKAAKVISVKIKGLKKGKSVITVKVGTKSAKTTVKVK